MKTEEAAAGDRWRQMAMIWWRSGFQDKEKTSHTKSKVCSDRNITSALEWTLDRLDIRPQTAAAQFKSKSCWDKQVFQKWHCANKDQTNVAANRTINTWNWFLTNRFHSGSSLTRKARDLWEKGGLAYFIRELWGCSEFIEPSFRVQVLFVLIFMRPSIQTSELG